ncbi:MAG: bifunctional pyr operon transcriptional regulator/uracil phosphoribosyltransferase PyrR [Clostridiales bacterium]|nr:bifunctional pyr operon transcriptional regulator/uracil phosphoribosyltransferase PyrR [Clostridiales bacterium]
MRFKAAIMNEEEVRRALIRIGHEIIERNRGVNDLVVVGIRSRGVPLAAELQSVIADVEGKKVPCGSLDITLYRDDYSLISDHPQIKGTDLPFSIEGVNVVLVDDVLYTGRTVRAAMEAISEMGRPKTIQLAVLVDRGGRELPIGANYVGKTLPTARNELVSVNVKETDGKNSVDIYSID